MTGPSSPSSVPTKPPKSKSNFITNFLSKSIVIILVLLVLSFFPSQVPEMFKETTIVTKLWDLIYLLVIGIAVCYGLFSRKIDSVHSPDDNIGGTETYLSGISHISSIFEEGVQNSYGFEEKSLFDEIKGSGSRFFKTGDGFEGESLFGESKDSGSRFGGIGESDGKKMNQYFLGESLVVIDDEKYVLEQLGRQKTSKQQKPLRLPVRNLGSKSLDSAAGKSVVEDSACGGDWDWDDIKIGKFRGVVPVKLEQKFKETDSDSDSDSRTRLHSRSKSMRMEKREDMFSAEANETSHFRHVSDAGLDFKGLKSQPMRSRMPSKIKNLSEKEELKGMEPSDGGFFEMNNRSNVTEGLKDFDGTLDGSVDGVMKDFGKSKVDDGRFESRNNAQFVKSKSQSSSIGASSETLKNMLRKEEIASSIPKSATIANTYKRGKSVRTNRLKEQVLEPKVNTDDKVEMRSKPGMNPMDVKADELSDTEPHSGEVDRKAEEFINKFREQIRLQRVASGRKLNFL